MRGQWYKRCAGRGRGIKAIVVKRVIMKLTRQKFGSSAAELNMASMIDVVFLLLIFFMCTSLFLDPEGSLQTSIAKAGSGASAEDFEPVRIAISQNGDETIVVCDGVNVGNDGQLLEMLRQRRAIADVRVIVDSGEDVDFENVTSVIDLCHQADLYRVGLSVKAEGGAEK